VDAPEKINPEKISTAEALERAGWVLRRADLVVQTAKERSLKASSLTTAQYSLLMHVEVYPGLNGAELGRLMGVTTQAVAMLAAKLQANGLLERRAHPRHRNIQEFTLSEEGRRTLAAAYTAVGEVEDRIRAALGPARTAQFKELLDAVIAEFKTS
jgi:DNA-binding MarR family transcriptional regulator